MGPKGGLRVGVAHLAPACPWEEAMATISGIKPPGLGPEEQNYYGCVPKIRPGPDPVGALGLRGSLQ